MADRDNTHCPINDKRMRTVLFLTDGLANGGAERQLALLVKYLPPSWRPAVFSFGDGPFADIMRSANIDLHIQPRHSRKDFRPAFTLWRVITRLQPDIVHSWGWMSTAAAGPLCRLARIPLVDGTIRVGRVIDYRGLANRLSMRMANYIVANSQAGLRAYQIGAPKGRVIYNGFDPDRFPLCHPDPGKASIPFTAVMAGRMVAVKDYRSFIASARQLACCDAPYAWRFVALGEGPDRASLMQAAADLVANGILEFPQPGMEVLPTVRQAHVGVLMTNPDAGAEGCSNAIMEYMACGLPVICSAGGGNHELVIDGHTGIIIPPRDPAALATQLAWLRDHPQAAQRLGAAGRDRIDQEFTMQRMVERTLTVYEEALSASSWLDRTDGSKAASLC
jgi:glycosyltransferase involved in cell wall biosynthesis